MEVPDILAPITFLIISILLFFYTYYKFNLAKDYMNKGIKTNAKVIKKTEIPSRDGDDYLYTLEYTDWKNNIITYDIDSTNRYIVGDIVKIVYTKDGKHKRIVPLLGFYPTIIFLFFVAFLLFFISIGSIISGM